MAVGQGLGELRPRPGLPLLCSFCAHCVGLRRPGFQAQNPISPRRPDAPSLILLLSPLPSSFPSLPQPSHHTVRCPQFTNPSAFHPDAGCFSDSPDQLKSILFVPAIRRLRCRFPSPFPPFPLSSSGPLSCDRFVRPTLVLTAVLPFSTSTQSTHWDFTPLGSGPAFTLAHVALSRNTRHRVPLALDLQPAFCLVSSRGFVDLVDSSTDRPESATRSSVSLLHSVPRFD